MPGPTYVKTVSKLYVPGETSVSFSHEGRAKDTAVCVVITARGANVTPVSALEYGGLAVPIKESNIRGTEPFPYIVRVRQKKRQRSTKRRTGCVIPYPFPGKKKKKR